MTAVFGKEPVIVFSGTYADITAQNGSLNSGSFVFMHTPMLEFLAAPHFGYELTAWTVNGNAITSGIEQKPVRLLQIRPSLLRQQRSRSTTSLCLLIRSVTRVTAVRFPQKSPARA